MAAEQSTHPLNLDEIWKPIPGYEGYYEVSDQGRVRSIERVIVRDNGMRQTVRSRVLRPALNRRGYEGVHLYRRGIGEGFSVHRLVLLAFVGPCPEGMEVRHLNGAPADNRLTNLRYGTSLENKLDIIRHGRHPELTKTHCKWGHPFADFNLVPSTRKKGARNCLACQRASSHIRRHPEFAARRQELSDRYFNALLDGVKNAA
ncbi:NUMOD4 motif-containing HNH endonuclease [Corynebacterium glyciniphilum]|uniref:NUMOD4 motif-containing HNH endonuclease n=1 Tax=Corynebacterium glyciniphilum TaxID=1404244 RepID=UPI003FD5A7B9